MYRVLFTGNTLSERDMAKLRSNGIEIVEGRTNYSEDELIELLQDFDGYILGGDEIATKKVISSTKKLKILSFLGTGYERFIDVEAATAKGIPVTNTPKANAYTTAEFTVGLLLDAVKKLTYLNNLTKQGRWQKLENWNLRGRILGIVGLGTVGTHVARILHQGFGMDIIYASRTPKKGVETELGAHRMDLSALLREADIISLHTAYSDETISLLGVNELAMAKTGAILVNSARAELVDGHALFQAITSGQISIAAFDGYYIEPIPTIKEDPFQLLGLPDDRFIVTPHTAYNSKDAIKDMEVLAISSVVDTLAGKIPVNVVNPQYKTQQ